MWVNGRTLVLSAQLSLGCVTLSRYGLADVIPDFLKYFARASECFLSGAHSFGQ